MLERPAAHISIEAYHPYGGDFAAGEDSLTEHFVRALPYIRAFTEDCAIDRGIGIGEVVASNCVLIDDYLNAPNSRYRPAQIVDMLTRSAKKAGIEIDYIAREEAYTQLARIAIEKLIEEEQGLPESQKTIRLHQGSAWLVNENPHPVFAAGAMEERPPLLGQNIDSSSTGHGIYLSIELWGNYGPGGERLYACPTLATGWELGREGDPMFHLPISLNDAKDFKTWKEMPPIIQLNPSAAPFAAESSATILSRRLIGVEHAVGVIRNRLRPQKTCVSSYVFF
jgi:hypothetical protein